MIKKREPGVRYKAAAEKDVALWAGVIAKMGWKELVDDLIETWVESEKGMIYEYSGFIDFDITVLERKADLYRERARLLAALA